MVQTKFKQNGMPQFKPLSLAAKRLAVTLSLLLGASLLTGCVTTSSTETKAQCAAWRSISYASPQKHPKAHDTAPTIKQVRVHNRAGQNLGCWK